PARPGSRQPAWQAPWRDRHPRIARIWRSRARGAQTAFCRPGAPFLSRVGFVTRERSEIEGFHTTAFFALAWVFPALLVEHPSAAPAVERLVFHRRNDLGGKGVRGCCLCRLARERLGIRLRYGLHSTAVRSRTAGPLTGGHDDRNSSYPHLWMSLWTEGRPTSVRWGCSGFLGGFLGDRALEQCTSPSRNEDRAAELRPLAPPDRVPRDRGTDDPAARPQSLREAVVRVELPRRGPRRAPRRDRAGVRGRVRSGVRAGAGRAGRA